MFTQKEFKEFRVDFKEAVKGLEEKYGIAIIDKGITYSSNSFDFKLEVVKGSIENKLRDDFMKHCDLFDIPKDSYGKEVIINNRIFKIVGIDTKKRKYCVRLQEVSTGKMAGIPSSTCLELLANIK